MQVKYCNSQKPRSDGKKGEPTEVTLNSIYTVVEDLDGKYSIINDHYKISRYSKERFEIIDDSPIKPLRESFNELTKELRMQLKELKNKE